ncbi:MAG: AarF/UbiB family protein [Pseudomonadota bacterium]
MLETAKRSLKILRIGWNAAKLKSATTEVERTLAKKALYNLFADARGVTMKVGQLLVQDDDTPLRPLLDNIEPLALELIGPYIETSMGKPLDEIFSEFDEAAAAASLGQVHHAKLLDGTEVAVKVRYPDIADSIAAEMRLAGLLPGLGPVKTWGFDLDAYKTELKQNMDRELDYRGEAARQQYFIDRVRVQGLHIPKVFPQYATDRVLVQSWESGVKFTEVLKWPDHLQHEVGVTLLKTLFKSVFAAGEVHADPHQGNSFYRYRNGAPEVVLLDFGCTAPIGEQARLALLKLIVALHHKQDVSPMACFAAMGFDGKKLSYIGQQLPMLSKILLRPFLENAPFHLSFWRLSEDLATLLGDKRWWFRSAGPANLLLLLRAFQGVVNQLQALHFYGSWWDILQQTVGNNLLAHAQTFELPVVPETRSAPTLSHLAKDLKVKVLERNQPVVSVSMPAEAALDLEKLIPEDVLTHLRTSKELDLKAVLQRIRDTGLMPQVVFDTRLGERSYRVWLE